MAEPRKSSTSPETRQGSTSRPTTSSSDASPSTVGAVGTRGTSIDQSDLGGKTRRGESLTAASGGRSTSAEPGIIDRVKQGATSRLTAQKDRATDGLDSITQAVRKSTESLRAEQHDTAARFVERTVDQLDRFSAQLRGKDISEIVDDAARLARRQPAIFIGLSFAAGLLAARFLKSSQERSSQNRAFSEQSSGAAGASGRFSGREMS
jgi:hypothetical protein